jgi:putative inorganic carbon (HCO3(-)) transporter
MNQRVRQRWYGLDWERLGPMGIAAAIGLLITFLPLPVAAASLILPTVLILIYLFPLLGLGLALLAGPFGAVESVILGPSPLDSGQILLLLTLVIWLLKGLGRGRVVIPATPLNLPLLLFLGVATLSSLNALSVEFALRELLKWVEMLLITWLIVDEFTSKRVGEWANCSPFTIHHSPFTILLILLPALLQAAIGIWQFGLRDDGPVHFLILGRFYRAYGTFEQPNPFGGYMALNGALAVGALGGWLVYFWTRRRDDTAMGGRGNRGKSPQLETRNPKLETLWFAFIGLSAAATGLALVMSWSRGAWLGFAAAVGVLVLFLPRKRWQGLLLIGLAIAGLWLSLQFNLLPASLADRLTGWQDDFQFGDVRGVDINDTNYAVLERLAHWQAALDMARDNLWLGVGFGNYEPAYADYDLINWPYPLGHAHNYYLNLLAEVGIIGTMAYLFLWATIFGQTIRLLKLPDWRLRGLALGLLAAWTALSVHHLLDKLYVNNIYIHLGAMLALLILLTQEAEHQKSVSYQAEMLTS